ncbi:AbrB/MazE/SpoVT family DNA-binding domain-containing protein [Mumia qirimensis]|uniref:AbrB/MazE/SpoVT family DNA-binding domain-containing protein n=1 Tax=Mumia qirimensis TaxID=3234852 RepID=UPI00351D0D0F
MPTATVTSKGQITIPAAVRASLGLHAGDRVQFIELPDGNYELRPATSSVRTLKGFFGPWDGDPVTVEEMDAAIGDAVTDR